jgi:hypothetical protein
MASGLAMDASRGQGVHLVDAASCSGQQLVVTADGRGLKGRAGDAPGVVARGAAVPARERFKVTDGAYVHLRVVDESEPGKSAP